MKRFFKNSALIFLTLVIFLAPISPTIGKTKINKAFAQNTGVNYNITKTDKSISVTVNIAEDYLDTEKDWNLHLGLYDKRPVDAGGNEVEDYKTIGLKNFSIDNPNIPNSFSYTFSGLSKDTTYHLGLVIIQNVSWYADILNFVDNFQPNIPFTDKGYFKLLAENLYGLEVTPEKYWWQLNGVETNSAPNVNDGIIGSSENLTPLNVKCNPLNLGGCIIQILYTLWTGTAAIARFAGHFLDFFIYYSTNNASYDNQFVTSAWAGVRDVANIFFIIALIYIAIKTILGLNVSDNKKLISMIIMMALFINFSLFATKVVIDTTNILAKVFYNNITPMGSSGEPLGSESNGEKSISVGLVDKFNFTNLISNETYRKVDSTGTFIFLLILLIFTTLYLAYVFLSVALLFMARVVSLWIGMILSPFAFASFAFGFKIEGLGHQDWWNDFSKNAIMAPIFVFLLYIIVMFAGFLGEVVKINPSNTTLMERLMTTMIPFLILMGLLHKSKEITKKYAGEMGKMVQSIGAAIGGLALGGAALTGGAVLKGTMGKFYKGASTGDTYAARLRAEEEQRRTNPNYRDPSLSNFGRAMGRLQRAPILMGSSFDDTRTAVGDRLRESEAQSGRTRHARHELDEAAKSVTEGTKTSWDQLNGTERFNVRRKLERERTVREQGKNWKFGNKKWEQLNQAQRDRVDNHIGVETSGPNKGRARAGSRLEAGTTHTDTDTIADSKIKQGPISTLEQSMVTGSYDLRGLAKVIARENTTGWTKFAMGLTGVLASGIRGGLKSALNINMGEPQAKLFKNLGTTITAALSPLKDIKLNVDLSHVGDEKKEGDKGGGGHH